jgi:hypothetical protein
MLNFLDLTNFDVIIRYSGKFNTIMTIKHNQTWMAITYLLDITYSYKLKLFFCFFVSVPYNKDEKLNVYNTYLKSLINGHI